MASLITKCIIKEKNWELEQEKCNQPDGVFHPEAENMRAISFGNETSIWVSKQLKTDKNFGSEVFFQNQDWRYSIIPVYEENKLARIVIIKENQRDFPTQIDKAKISNLSGKWKLKQTKMTPSLQMSTQEVVDKEIGLDLSIPGNENYLLPEKIMLSLPKEIAIGREFEIVAGKQIRENLYKQIKISYDTTGKLISLISEVYELEYELV